MPVLTIQQLQRKIGQLSDDQRAFLYKRIAARNAAQRRVGIAPEVTFEQSLREMVQVCEVDKWQDVAGEWECKQVVLPTYVTPIGD